MQEFLIESPPEIDRVQQDNGQVLPFESAEQMLDVLRQRIIANRPNIRQAVSSQDMSRYVSPVVDIGMEVGRDRLQKLEDKVRLDEKINNYSNVRSGYLDLLHTNLRSIGIAAVRFAHQKDDRFVGFLEDSDSKKDLGTQVIKDLNRMLWIVHDKNFENIHPSSLRAGKAYLFNPQHIEDLIASNPFIPISVIRRTLRSNPYQLYRTVSTINEPLNTKEPAALHEKQSSYVAARQALDDFRELSKLTRNQDTTRVKAFEKYYETIGRSAKLFVARRLRQFEDFAPNTQYESQQKKLYEIGFMKSVSVFSQLAVKQAEQGSPSLLQELMNPAVRSNLFQLAASDYENMAKTLATANNNGVSYGWQNVRAYVHTPEQITNLRDKFAESLGMGFVKSALRTRPYDTETFLEQALEQINNLAETHSQDLRLREIKSICLKHSDPELVIERTLKEYRKLKQDKLIGILSPHVIKQELITNPRRYRKSLREQAITKAFAAIPIKDSKTTLTPIQRALIADRLQQFDRIKAFDSFSAPELVYAANNLGSEAPDALARTLQLTEMLSRLPRYRTIPETLLRQACLYYQKTLYPTLDRIVEISNWSSQSDVHLQYLSMEQIQEIALHNPRNTRSKITQSASNAKYRLLNK